MDVNATAALSEKMRTQSSSPETTVEKDLTPGQPSLRTASYPSSQQSEHGPGAELPLQRTISRVSSRRAPLPPGREFAFVFVVCCAQLFTQASLGQSIPILPYISPTFGGLAAGELSWIPAAFSLTVGTFIIIAGRIGDIVGHKVIFVAGWAWLSLWSLLAGLSALAASQIFFDVCRAMQGMACAALLPSSLALLGSHYPPGRRKEMVFSIFGATAPNGFMVGAAFAGILAQLAWWPWAYWAMAVASAGLAGASIVVVPPLSDEGSSIGPQRFDYAGAVTGVAGLVLINVAWNQAPSVGWQTPYVIALLVVGLAFAAAFVVIEGRVAQPLLPVSALSREVCFVLGCVVLGWSSFGIWVFYLWQFLEELRGLTPLLATAQLSPVCVAGIVAALLTGYLLSRWRPEVIMLISLCMFCLGSILLATMPVGQTYWAETFLAVILTPFGMDMNFPAASIILSNAVPRRHQGIAASLVVTAVNYSISIGLGIGGTVESRVRQAGGDALLGYRSAAYAAIGLSGLGILLAVVFVVHHAAVRSKANKASASLPVEPEHEPTPATA